MSKAWLVKQNDGTFEAFYTEPMRDESGTWYNVGGFDTVYPDLIPMHSSLLNMSSEDTPVEVMIAPVDMVSTKLSDEYFVKIARALRPLWPAGDKSEKYSWRDSIDNLAARLRTLWDVRKLKEYTIEECTTVANKYLNGFRDDAKYMQTLKYFILKQDKVIDHDGRIHYTNKSKFADMLESKSSMEDDFLEAFGEMNQSDNLV